MTAQRQDSLPSHSEEEPLFASEENLAPSDVTLPTDDVTTRPDEVTVSLASTEYSELNEICLSDSLLVPLPPTPYYKIQNQFLFDDVTPAPDDVTTPPKDPYNLFFVAFMVLGAGFHLPFNSFVAAVDYFMLTYQRNNMAFLVASTNSYTVCIAVVVNVLLVNRVSTHARITFGYLAFLLSLLSMALLVILTIFDLVDHEVGFQVTIGAAVLTGIGCGVQEASYYGWAGVLPSRYTRAIMLGESFAGLVVSVNRIVTKLTIEDPLTNTVIFFSLSIVGEVVCVVLHRYIKDSGFVRWYSGALKGDQEETFSTPGPPKHMSMLGGITEGFKLRLAVSREIWRLMFGILNVYLVTNLLYPGFSSIIGSSWPHGWLPVVLITFFNLSDFLGTLATSLSWKMSDNLLLQTGVVRWLLVPLLLLTVLPLSAPLITSEAVPISVITVLGFTTGYLGSTPMCAAAEKVDIRHRELAGNLMTMMMLMGLTLGSTSALVVNTVMGVGDQTEF